MSTTRWLLSFRATTSVLFKKKLWQIEQDIWQKDSASWLFVCQFSQPDVGWSHRCHTCHRLEKKSRSHLFKAQDSPVTLDVQFHGNFPSDQWRMTYLDPIKIKLWVTYKSYKLYHFTVHSWILIITNELTCSTKNCSGLRWSWF